MDVIAQVFLIFTAGVVAAALAARLGLPAIVGELLAGVLLGPHVAGWIHLNQSSSTLATLGVVLLLFTAGLEMRVSEIAGVGRPAAVASLSGAIVSAAGVFGVASAFGYRSSAALLAAIALAATSVGIGARAFGDLGLLRERPGRVMMGAAVVDDVVALVALSIALASATGRSTLSISITVASAVGFIALVVAAGPAIARRHGTRLAASSARHSPVVPALVLCLGLAALAERAGLAALVGAFLAGMVLAETREQVPLERGMRPVAEFLVPFFFVTVGARVDPHTLVGAGLPLALALGAVAIAAKLAGCGAGAVGLSMRERTLVGAGMVARGEVTLAAASAALAAGRIPQRLFSAILAAVFVSAFAGPLAVRALAGNAPRTDPEPTPP
jgi:Kef-type K+ transport system membrane component KefB